jgi:hypothetical protein
MRVVHARLVLSDMVSDIYDAANVLALLAMAWCLMNLMLRTENKNWGPSITT